MIDGRLFAGAHGLAGAIGHVPWRRGGPRCSCGRRGCIEAEASGPAIARAFDACARSGAVGIHQGSLSDVLGAMESSDEHARSCAVDVTARAGRRLGRVVGGLANTIDPDVIVLGGGAALALGDGFIDAFRSSIEEVAIATPARVVPSRLGPSVSVVGAGLLALDGIEGGSDR